MSERQAFTGIRILDFTQVLAGPFATQQLAQLGAEVIKIEERTAGDMTRGLASDANDGMAPSFLTCNLGKRSITLDLKHPSARDVVHRLVERCDVVVENFKPGTIEGLGFGYEALSAIKPDIIYASISGFGQQGPKAKLPAFDGAIQAASGMMSVSGHVDTGPTRTGYFAVDMSTALNAAFAISAALYRRQVTGEGQHIDVAMMDTAFMMQAPQVTAYLVDGTLPDLLGNRSPTKQPTSNVFPTTDGFVQIAAMKEPQVRGVLRAVGAEELYDKYPEAVDRVRATDEFNAALMPAFASNTTEYWLAALRAIPVPCASIQDLAEATSDEQVAHRLSLTEIEHPTKPGETVQVASASHMTQPAPPKVQRPPPTLGEHTDEVLAELGYDQAQISALREEGAV